MLLCPVTWTYDLDLHVHVIFISGFHAYPGPLLVNYTRNVILLTLSKACFMFCRACAISDFSVLVAALLDV